MAELIICDPSILGGKPCVGGTRVSVAHILELLASGATREAILAAHPRITAEGLSAALEYAARSLKNDVVWGVARDRALAPNEPLQTPGDCPPPLPWTLAGHRPKIR